MMLNHSISKLASYSTTNFGEFDDYLSSVVTVDIYNDIKIKCHPALNKKGSLVNGEMKYNLQNL